MFWGSKSVPALINNFIEILCEGGIIERVQTELTIPFVYFVLGSSVTVALQTLDLPVLVRIQAPQPSLLVETQYVASLQQQAGKIFIGRDASKMHNNTYKICILN